jgi:hypothetical protein
MRVLDATDAISGKLFESPTGLSPPQVPPPRFPIAEREDAKTKDQTSPYTDRPPRL